MPTPIRPAGIRILLLDIETSPNIVYSWGLRDQNISLNQIIEPSKVLCWAAKWLGEDPVHFSSLKQRKPLQMLGKMHRLLEQADAVVHFNGKSFDIKHLNREFLEYNFEPPSPFKQIDLLQVARQNFKFLSNKLQYLLEALELGEKGDPGGMETWAGCLKNNPKAWETMKQYNISDVVEMEKLYLRLRPWIKGHPNYAMYSPEKAVCPVCGSDQYQHRGWYRSERYIYRKYSCKVCKKPFRGIKSEGGRQVEFTGVV